MVGTILAMQRLVDVGVGCSARVQSRPWGVEVESDDEFGSSVSRVHASLVVEASKGLSL